MKANFDGDGARGRCAPLAGGRYRCVRVIGSGGMGTVVLARDLVLRRLVALKLLRERCALFLARLSREARILARLEHPAIVRVLDADLEGERPFLALEYVRGGSLAEARLAPAALVRVLAEVADALAHAHAHGIVHRDVKPDNVLLSDGLRARLGDFGLALGRGEGFAPHAVAGTLQAMSPEQVRGSGVGPASDQFSLGATAYRQLTGEWPFRGRTVGDVVDAIEHAEPVPPRTLVAGVPRALERVVLRLLAKDPAARFPSMRAARDALLRVRPSPLARLLARAAPSSSDGRDGDRRLHPPSTFERDLP